MSILSRYKLMTATYELTYLDDQAILSIIEQVKGEDAVLKAVKILSLSLIDGTKTEGQILNYYDSFIRQMLSLQSYNYIEEEIQYLIYFVICKYTPFLLKSQNVIKNLIMERDNLPNNEVYDFIEMYLKYALLDVYSKEIYNNPELIEDMHQLLNELEDNDEWYMVYLQDIQNDPFTAGKLSM